MGTFYGKKRGLAVACLLLFVQVCIASEAATYSIEQVVQGMLAAEASYKDLYIEYTYFFNSARDPNAPSVFAEAVYAQKRVSRNGTPQVLRYKDWKTYWVDPNGQRLAPIQEARAAFDGEATRMLYRLNRGAQASSGWIRKGYYPAAFHDALVKDPQTTTWHHGAGEHSFADVIKEFADRFEIESTSEPVDGVSTIKLVGKLYRPPQLGGTLRLWVAPERSFLPLKRQYVKPDGEVFNEVVLYDLTKLSNGLWYPQRIRFPAESADDSDRPPLFELEIKKISVEPLAEEFFRPAFPAGTDVIDEILGASYTTY